MRAMLLNDGERFTALAGCKIVDVDDALDGAEVDAAIKAGRCVVVREFDGSDAGPLAPAERERLRALLAEYAGLHERSATLTDLTAGEREAHGRDAELLRRHAALI